MLVRFFLGVPDAQPFTSCLWDAMLPVQALTSQAMEIQFTIRIFKEGRTYVAHALELDVSSCGGSKEKALSNLKEAVRLFLEEAEKMGTLEQILEEAGFRTSTIALSGIVRRLSRPRSSPGPFWHPYR